MALWLYEIHKNTTVSIYVTCKETTEKKRVCMGHGSFSGSASSYEKYESRAAIHQLEFCCYEYTHRADYEEEPLKLGAIRSKFKQKLK